LLIGRGIAIFGIIVEIFIAWYLLSPLFINIELDGESPLDLGDIQVDNQVEDEIGEENLEEDSEVIKAEVLSE
jgi:hypothetical protein